MMTDTSAPMRELALDLPDALHDEAVAALDALGFAGFVETDDRLTGYIEEARWTEDVQAAVGAWLGAKGLGEAPEGVVVAPRNWNAEVEAQLGAVLAPPFLVRPSWAPRPDGTDHLDELVIEPKMSFGTGYHESTRLVLGLLPGAVRAGDRVLDAGTGTGILAIAAIHLGAAHAIAFDIDRWAEENAAENVARNGADGRIEVRSGDIDCVPEDGFDVVVANIHREVLTAMMPDLTARTRPGGALVLAGLLTTDAEAMRALTAAHGFEETESRTENAWWAWAGRLTGRRADPSA